MFLVLVGPDGSGKSTLAKLIIDGAAGAARDHLHLHWRPGLLPRLGSLIKSSEGDIAQPHSRQAHSPVVSTCMALYYWLDFFLGSWVRIRPVQGKNGLIIMERGWWDFAIDPLRYRLAVHRRLVELLGYMLPKPDGVVILETPPETLLERKQELPADELARQARGWRVVRLPASVPRFYLDGSRDPETNALAIKEWMTNGVMNADPGWSPPDLRSQGRARPDLRSNGSEALSLPDGDWTGLPRKKAARWILPRRSRQVARGGLAIYHPVTNRGLLAWKTARGVAAMGGFRLLARSQHLPPHVETCLMDIVSPQDDIAVARANHPGRFVALVLDENGNSKLFVKIVGDANGRAALAKERDSIKRFGGYLQHPLAPPRVVTYSDDFLVMEPIRWVARANAWWLSPNVAFALGTFYATGDANSSLSGAGSAGPQSRSGNGHGDFAPWNLLQTEDGWTVIDWENARSGLPPFYDLWHYVVQSHGLLGRPSMDEIRAGLKGTGWIGEAAAQYAHAADLRPENRRTYFFEYLAESETLLDPSTPEGKRGLQIRDRLRRELNGRP